jgi:hypothetical protein
MEWSGVISGYSMEFHGVPKGDVARPNRAYRLPFGKAVSYCQIGYLRSSSVAISNPATFPLVNPYL